MSGGIKSLKRKVGLGTTRKETAKARAGGVKRAVTKTTNRQAVTKTANTAKQRAASAKQKAQQRAAALQSAKLQRQAEIKSRQATAQQLAQQTEIVAQRDAETEVEGINQRRRKASGGRATVRTTALGLGSSPNVRRRTLYSNLNGES